MKVILRVGLISIAAGLTACASDPTAEELPGFRADPAQMKTTTITGSRIQTKSTEKMVAQVGTQDYLDMMKAKNSAPLK